MRVTKNYIKKWVDEELKKKKLPFHVTRIHTTKYTEDLFEKGAARMNVFCKHNNSEDVIVYFIFYKISELQKYFNDGFRFVFVSEDEIDIQESPKSV